MFIQTQLFTNEECNKIINLIPNLQNTDGHQKYSKNDSVDVSFDEYKISITNDTNWFIKKLQNYVEEVLHIKLNILNTDVHVLKYKINDEFSLHIDYDPNPDGRIYTIGILLNDTFEGGDFILYPTKSEKIILDKAIGCTYLFDTTTPHEVTKITNGERYTLIVHIRNSEIQKRNLF